MFSCALFHSGSETPVLAKSSEVSVQVMGLVGQGKATCSYNIDHDSHDTLFYVPSLLAIHSVTRQHVRLSRCEVSLAQAPAGKTVTQHLQVTKLDDLPHDNTSSIANGHSGSEVPDYTELRRRYKAAATKLCGSHSYEDVLLHVGDLPRGSQLTVRFEFLIRFSSSSQCPPMQYNIQQSLPSLQLSYNLLLGALSPVADVTTNMPLPTFSWEYLYSGDQHRNLVQVSYSTICQPNGGLNWGVGAMPEVTIHLNSGMSAGCCSCLPALHGALGEHHSVLAPYDGVMMMNTVFTAHQLPKSVRVEPYSPSEFVFVVDCSGSMSGSNIQITADTLITCIKSLPAGCYFNVVAFGSTFRQLFHSSQLYTQSSMDSAVQFANQLQASLGGTELLGPLRWIFKAQRCSSLPCQVFIITDGGVTNTTSVLRCVRKNRHQARCHTFGIGGEVCVELVTGIAAASGGQCVLLSPTERLQTKVMEVLKDSMQPSVSNVVLQWHPPKGYSVVDSSPRNLGTLFSGNSYSAFAFLRKSEPTMNGTPDAATGNDITGTATLTGLVNGEQVEIMVDPMTLPALSVQQSKETTSLLSQSAVWSKLCDLELQALSTSRKNSHNDSEEQSSEPPAKKPRLNGSHCSTPPLTSTKQKPLLENPVREELTELSLRSGILCPLTYLKSECGYIKQIVPLPHSSLSKPTKPALQHHNSTIPPHYRKRKHYSSNHHMSNSTQPSTIFALSSLAKNTFSAIGSTLKTVANITTFGLIGQESAPVIENGQSIEDEMEYQENRHSQLHWDDAKGNIVYPDIYYRSHPSNKHRHASSEHSRSKRSRHSRHTHRSVQAPVSFSLSTSASLSAAPLTEHTSYFPNHRLTESAVAGNHSGDEDEGLTISDSESDSSVDPDWEDLRKPSELLPLIHIQLFSGAWPLLRAFSYAVGVPLEEIRKLPLHKNALDSTQMNGHTNSAENNAHLWATALAVACLEEHFSELRSEWEVVAYKGRCWIEQELQYTKLSLDQVQRTARELVQRQS